MTTGLLVPSMVENVSDYAVRAERLGYDRFWTGELWGRDAFVSLTAAACRTEDLEFGTSIVNVFGRSPATLAQAAATLQRESGGRFTLGLGTSTRKAVEDLHGKEWDRPARRTHETTELTKLFLTAEGRVDYDGELYDVADFPSQESEVPVYTAALGPAMRRATGRTADGWLPHNIPFERLPEAFEVIADAARDAGRNPADFEVAPYVPAAVADDPAEARDIIRGHVAYYAGSGAGYRRAIGAHFDETEAIAAAWQDGDRDLARERVTDDMVHALGVAGTESAAREQLERVREVGVVDEPIVVMPGGADEETMDRTIDALAP
jgi:alkanesulfonate monooxygenase SsuD/methylene tetrahydromethanopterin reductase-like flavin-dependent oxidoreductase (luciferase family)